MRQLNMTQALELQVTEARKDYPFLKHALNFMFYFANKALISATLNQHQKAKFRWRSFLHRRS